MKQKCGIHVLVLARMEELELMTMNSTKDG
jgi:hypothetical protein